MTSTIVIIICIIIIIICVARFARLGSRWSAEGDRFA